ncbi:hypothetical protein [Bradyrhizobium sp. URHD0069]|uniref:hypothetical protein n=1 Tax=Bradyrhizobium sp. URHD0069 TaxID=1380355 RepID=UPI000AFB814F|nr:hypothetical protein [Bradyrhizobium sp. URHD0069]
MRVAMIAVILVVSTPSEASKSCMTKTEARQHFGSVHIYWHGNNRCWDATPTRRRHRIYKVQKKIQIPKVQEADQIHKVRQPIDQPKWQTAMSEMSLDEEPVQTPWIDRWIDIEPLQLPIVARSVDMVQAVPPSIIEFEPMVTPRSVVMVIIAIVMTLAIIEILFGGTIYNRPTSTRKIRFPH